MQLQFAEATTRGRGVQLLTCERLRKKKTKMQGQEESAMQLNITNDGTSKKEAI
jgi:hypothetical protein